MAHDDLGFVPTEKSAPHDDLGFTPSQDSSYSALQSGLMGAGNQFNLAPVLGAAVQHPLEAFKAAMNPLARLAGAQEASPESTQDFTSARDDLNKQFSEAQSANPKSYLAGNIAGGLALTPVLPGASGVIGGLKAGAALGGLSGIGSALSSGQDVSDVAKEGLGGAATGGVLGGALGGVLGKVAEGLHPENLENSASRNTIESLMPSKSTAKSLETSPLSEDVKNAAGQVVYKAPAGKTYLEQAGDVLKPYLETGSSARDRAKVINDLIESSGKDLGAIKQQAIDGGAQFTKPSQVLSFIDELKSQFVPSGEASGVPFENQQSEADFLNRTQRDLMRLLGTGEEPVSFAKADEAMQYLKNEAYNKDGSLGTTVNNNLASGIRGFMNDLAEKDLANQISPEDFNKFMDAKELFRAASSVKKAAQGASAADISNRDFGLLSHSGALVGGHTAGPVGALAGLALDNLAKTGTANLGYAKAAQGLADAQRTVGSGISKGLDVVQQKASPVIGKVLTSATPETLQTWAAKASASTSPTMQNLGKIFSEASTRDQVGRNALMFTLLQNPTYRDLLHSVAGEPVK
jgi:hypothetical protein